MAYELPALPYDLNALEPQISKETLEYHYGKHHAGYVKNLNGLVGGTEFENSGLDEIVKKAGKLESQEAGRLGSWEARRL